MKTMSGWIVCALAFLLFGCGENQKLHALADTAASASSGWRVLVKVDKRRQSAIRVQARVDAHAADAAMNRHEASYAIADTALSTATDVIEKVDREGFSAALLPVLIKAGLDVTAAVKAFQEVK